MTDCCFAELEAGFRRVAGQVPVLDVFVSGVDVDADAGVDWDTVCSPCSDTERLFGSVFDFDRLLQDHRHVWSALDGWCSGPWRVSGPCWPKTAGWDALRELPRTSKALDDLSGRLGMVDSDGLSVVERAVHEFMIGTAGLFTERLASARAGAVAESWRRRFCLMALTSVRFPNLFGLESEQPPYSRATRVALSVLARSGDPCFAVELTFTDPISGRFDGDSTEFDRVTQTLRTDLLLSEPDRVLAVPRNQPRTASENYLGWLSDLLWWCGFAEHGDWLVASVPAVCAVHSVTVTSCFDLGAGRPSSAPDLAMLDLALTVADVAPFDGGKDALRFAENVLAPPSVC